MRTSSSPVKRTLASSFTTSAGFWSGTNLPPELLGQAAVEIGVLDRGQAQGVGLHGNADLAQLLGSRVRLESCPGSSRGQVGCPSESSSTVRCRRSSSSRKSKNASSAPSSAAERLVLLGNAVDLDTSSRHASAASGVPSGASTLAVVGEGQDPDPRRLRIELADQRARRQQLRVNHGVVRIGRHVEQPQQDSRPAAFRPRRRRRDRCRWGDGCSATRRWR